MEFGQVTLSTERLRLRQLEPDDAHSLFSIYSDKETMKYWDSLPFSSPGQARDMISEARAWWEAGDSIRLAIEERDSSLAIGTVSLFSFHEESKRAELGYILGRPYWRRGFMYEALARLIDYAFSELGLNRLEADVDPDNVASTRLLKKLEFSLEGRLKQRWIVNGRVSDSEIYGLVRGDFNIDQAL